MTILASGNELDIFTHRVGPALAFASTADTDIAIAGINRAGFQMHGTPTTVYGDVGFTPVKKGWARVRIKVTSTHVATAGNVITLLDEDGNEIFFLYAIGGSGFAHEGEAKCFADSVGASMGVLAGVHTLDFNWNIDPVDGYFRMYADDLLIYEYLGDTQFDTSNKIATLRLSAYQDYASEQTRYSQIIVATTPTLGGVVYTLPITGVGTYAGWEGDTANIIGTGISATTGILATLNNQQQTFTHEDMPELAAGVELNAIILSEYARFAEDAEVQYQAGLVDDGGSLYETPTQPISTPNAGRVQHIMEQNPLGGDWDVATVNSFDFGVRAKVSA